MVNFVFCSSVDVILVVVCLIQDCNCYRDVVFLWLSFYGYFGFVLVVGLNTFKVSL